MALGDPRERSVDVRRGDSFTVPARWWTPDPAGLYVLRRKTGRVELIADGEVVVDEKRLSPVVVDSARFQARVTPGAEDTLLEITPVIAGNLVTAVISAADSDSLNESGVYDLEATSGDTVKTLRYGDLNVDLDVAHD